MEITLVEIISVNLLGCLVGGGLGYFILEIMKRRLDTAFKM